jgi:hypothetical protein
MHLSNREIRNYYRDIQRRLPYVPKEKKKYLQMLRQSMDSFLADHPSAAIEDIYEEFGTVEQICTEYKDNLSSEQLTGSIRRTKMICGCFGLLAAAIVGFAAYFVYDVYAHAPADVQTTITILEETEIIEHTEITEE